MSNEIEPRTVSTTSTAPEAPPRKVRVAPAVALVAVFWAFYAVAGALNLGQFPTFMMRFGAVALLLLLFCIWWLVNRGLPFKERLAVLVAAILGGVIALGVLRDPSVLAPAVLYYATPILITAMVIWLVATRRSSPAWQRLGLFGIPLVAWVASDLVRMDGLSGENTPVFHWRWTPTGEAQFLAERVRFDQEKQPPKNLELDAEPLVAGPHDWPRFRGPNFDSAVHGVRIATNWNESPPKLRWRRRIGPGWSSLTVVAMRIFTQEQRGDLEAVVCFDAKTGDELWSHEDKARFYEALGGAGPRATPTFADGMVYALGATGVLNCLDAATGERKWSQDIVPAEVKAAEQNPAANDETPKPPIWGYSSSPLVVGDVVIVFAGSIREKGLVAFKADSGEPAWTAESGTHSYSSPQLATLDGVGQVLYLSNDELTSVDPATGKILWRFESAFKQYHPSIQPQFIGPSEVLVSFTEASGTMRLKVERAGDNWSASPVWKTAAQALKPYFNDFVNYDGSLYGFDGALFASVDADTGKRQWKKGRYGAGQVLLLADQGVLLVLTEQGEAVLVAADPKKHRELGRFQAINGKTWNHPTIVGDRLYVRNAEEMACYELETE
jgi:outer membrane protein assembly factor BamB